MNCAPIPLCPGCGDPTDHPVACGPCSDLLPRDLRERITSTYVAAELFAHAVAVERARTWLQRRRAGAHV